MSRLVWEAVEGLAAQWKASPVVARYAAPLTGPASPLGRALAGQTTSSVDGQPLLHARILPASPGFAQVQAVAGAAEWLADGSKIAGLFLITVEWLRARLPGYPLLAAPQLVRNSPWTSGELPLRIPWLLPQLRTAGLQFRPAPPGVADGLQIPHRFHDNNARKLAAALAATEVAVSLEQALAGLTPADEKALAGARAELRRSFANQQVGIAGSAPVKRLAYREAVMHQTIQQLPRKAREFALAAEAAGRLIFQATALFSQLVIFGPPRVLQDIRRVERTSGGDGWTEVVVVYPPGPPIRMLEVLHFCVPGLDQAMLVEGYTVRIPTPEEPGEVTLNGRLLPGSAQRE